VNLASFIGEFKAESLEHLERLGSGLLALERTPTDAALIRKLFLSAHTIKGGSSMLELQVLKTLTHAFEDVLARLRDGKDTADSATVTLLLAATDAIRALVEDNPTLETPTPQLEGLIENLRARARGETVSVTSEPVPPNTPAEQHATTAAIFEPSDTARLLLRLQLEERGWTVRDFATQDAFLAGVAEAKLVVLPLEPGGVDGLQLASELQARQPGTQVALSALDFSESQRLEAERLGARCVSLTSWRENPYWSAEGAGVA
jgi:chemotaxis protein histidine kinase CheA